MSTLTKTLALVAGLSLSLSCAVTSEEAINLDTEKVRAGETPVGNLIRVPIVRTPITDYVFHISGLSNVYLVNTAEGSIVIDTGFAHQAPEQMRLVKEAMTAPLKYIFLPQAQQDDIGGIDIIKEDDTQIMMTRASMEYMEHRAKAAQFLQPRYFALYSWAAELLKQSQQAQQQMKPPVYEPITPDVIVEDQLGKQFELGGVKFEVIALPGAEGINSAGLWMPEEKILFAGGGSIGPEIPMWPNIGTIRADTNRILTKYIDTLNTMLDLEIEILLPGQDAPIQDKDTIKENLTLIRDASVYVHDEIWKGLSAGKDVYQLMKEIQLPENLAHLSQKHGRVEWAVRETVNQAGAWFAYKHTSEMYPYRPHEIYAELAALAGEDKIIAATESLLEEGELERALLMIEVAIEASPESTNVLNTQMKVLEALLAQAKSTHNTFSEIAWLQLQMTQARKIIGNQI